MAFYQNYGMLLQAPSSSANCPINISCNMTREMVADRNGWSYSANLVQSTSHTIIDAFSHNPSFDVLLGDFTLTWKRLMRYNVSFTTPFVSKGLLLMRKAPKTADDGWWIVKSFTTWCWALFFIFVFISAFVIWLCEHWDNLSFRYIYQHCCCCKSLEMTNQPIATVEDENIESTDILKDIFTSEPTEGRIHRQKSSKSVGDLEMSSIRSTTSTMLSSDTADIETTIHDSSTQLIITPIPKSSVVAKPKKKPKFIPVMGNTLALFWFGGNFPHVRGAPAKFLISFLKLWVLVMSAFYMSNLTALRTAEVTQPTKIQSTNDMWHARICTKRGSFIEEFLYDELALPSVITCEQPPECVDMLRSDRCDGFVSTSHWIQYVSQQNCDLEIVGDLFRPEFASWIVKPQSPYLSAINDAIIRLRSEGVVDKLYKKYIEIPKRCSRHIAGGKWSGNDNQVDVVELEIMWICIALAWLFTLSMQWYRTRS